MKLVKLGTDVFTGHKVAIKIVDWSMVEDIEDTTESLEREIRIMKLLDHPNIVRLYDIITHKDDKKTFLIMEYVARGELFDYIVASGRIKESESRRFFRQLVSAVEYTHAFLVIHRDLKPSNLLLADDGSIKVTDFGLSNTMTPGKLFTTWCGSLYYSAPEIIEEKKYVGPAVDIWSMGVILYALVNGRLPWSGKTDLEKIRQIVVSDVAPAEPHITPECVSLIKGCLRPDSAKRFTIQDIRAHPWTNTGYSEPPPCLVPEAKPVQKVHQDVLDQLVFLGFLEKSGLAKAEEMILRNEKNQVVYAYHLLLTKPQLLVSSSFLPKETIKAALAGTPRKLRHDEDELDSDDDDVGGDGEAADGISALPDVTRKGVDDADAARSQHRERRSRSDRRRSQPVTSDAPLDPRRVAAANATAAAGSGGAITAAAAGGGGSSATAADGAASGKPKEEIVTRRRAMTVSAGAVGTTPAPRYTDVLKLKLMGDRKEKVALNQSAPSAGGGGSAPKTRGGVILPDASVLALIEENEASGGGGGSTPSGAPPARSAASRTASPPVAEVRTRPRSMSMGQRRAPPPMPSFAVADGGDAAGGGEKKSKWRLFGSRKKNSDKAAARSDSEKKDGDKVGAAGGVGTGSDGDAAGEHGDAGSAGGGEDEMRTVKGVFKCATTSPRPPHELMAVVENALVLVGTLKYKRKGAYLFRCLDKKAKVRLEIEVCKIDKLEGLYGVRFSRLSGDSWNYKRIAESLMEKLSL